MLTETKPSRLLAACMEDQSYQRKLTPSLTLYDAQDQSKSDLVSLSWLQKGNLLKIPPIDQDEYATASFPSKKTFPKAELENIPDTAEKDTKGDDHLIKNMTNFNKPNYSYTHLIFMAIESTPSKYMTVNQIYNWCETNFPYYKHAGTGWKNSLRHNLSINKCFKRLPRDNRGSGRGAYWAIEPRERQHLIDGINRNPWNITAIACSGSPKINESGHMNVTATLNSLGCNRYAKFNSSSILQKNTLFHSLTKDENGHTTLSHSLLPNTLFIKGPSSQMKHPLINPHGNNQLSEAHMLLDYFSKGSEGAYNLDSPRNSNTLGASMNSSTTIGSSSVVSAADSYLSSYFSNSIGNAVQTMRKYFSDDPGSFEAVVRDEENLEWNEADDILYSEALILMEENHDSQKIKEPESTDIDGEKPASCLLQTVAKITDQSCKQSNKSSQLVTKQRRKSSLKPTIEFSQQDLLNDTSSGLTFPSGSRSIFSKIGYKVIPEKSEISPDDQKPVPCPECKENASLDGKEIKTESETDPESPQKSTVFCENCSQERSIGCKIRYYTEAEWFTIYPHLRTQLIEQEITIGNGINHNFNGDVLNSLDFDQETGPAGFPTMMLPSDLSESPTSPSDSVSSPHRVKQDPDEDPRTCETNQSKETDIFITPAPMLDHEYAHCQAQLRTPKDQSVVNRYNNKVKAYLELVRSTLVTTPNAMITPFEYFLNDSQPSQSRVGPDSSKLSRRSTTKQPLTETPVPSSQANPKAKKPRPPPKTKPITSRRVSTRQIRAPKRPYDEVGLSEGYLTSDEENESRLYRKRRPLAVLSKSESLSKSSLEEELRDDEFLDSVEESLSDESLKRKLAAPEKSLSIEEDEVEDWVSDIEDQYNMYCEEKTRFQENKKHSAGLLSRFSESEDDFDDDEELDSMEAEYFTLARRRTFGNLASTIRKIKPTNDFTQLKDVFLRKSSKSNLSGHDSSSDTVKMGR